MPQWLHPRPAWSVALNWRRRTCSVVMTTLTSTTLLVSTVYGFRLLYMVYTRLSATRTDLFAFFIAVSLSLPVLAAVLIVSTLVAVLVEIFLDRDLIQARYATKRLRREYRRLARHEPFPLTTTKHTHVPARLAEELAYAHRKDEFPSMRLNKSLADLRHELSRFSLKSTEVLEEKHNLPTALSLLHDRFDRYHPPYRHPYASPPPALSAPYPDRPHLLGLFSLSATHLVERPAVVSLTFEQFALRLVLQHAARPASRDPHTRIVLAPTWVYALLTYDPAWQEDRTRLDPSTFSTLYQVEDPEVVFDLLCGIWSPSQSFDRALAAAVKLSKIPVARRASPHS
jgi:hypothetical protein